MNYAYAYQDNLLIKGEQLGARQCIPILCFLTDHSTAHKKNVASERTYPSTVHRPSTLSSVGQPFDIQNPGAVENC